MQPSTGRIGLTLFAIYVTLYGGFMLLSAFWPSAMEAKPFAGINLAILYGFGLIVAAFGLALLYGLIGPAEQAGTESAEGTEDRA
jgi:uncharacterized membrane protein (DUF485 family)